MVELRTVERYVLGNGCCCGEGGGGIVRAARYRSKMDGWFAKKELYGQGGSGIGRDALVWKFLGLV